MAAPSSFPFDAVLFDCDGVLVDSEVVGLEDAVDFLNRHGFDLTTASLIRRFSGMRSDLFKAELRSHYALILDREPDEAEFSALFDGMVAARRAQRHTMTIVPGALGAVARAAEVTGGRIAVASSSAQQQLDDKVERFGFAPHFGDHVYSADRVEHGKPAPDIFLYAAQALGLPPARCLVIEDSPHGATAGIRAGMTVWGFTGGGHCLDDHPGRLRDAGAVRVLSDHETLRDAFRA